MPKQPKVFISYCWSSEEHESWVLDLATRLVSDGVNVVLDKWDLEIGHDKYAFMERMVNDETISKVIIICDKGYMDKANARRGGVGTESQIISQEIYEKVDQNKFVPVVVEHDEHFSPCMPTFLRNRMFIDLSPSSDFTDNCNLLLRSLYDLPLYPKPPVGVPPEHIMDAFRSHPEIRHRLRAQSTSTEIPLDQNVRLPDFEVINEVVDDMPIKTQIQQDIIVSGQITKEGIQQLLFHQHESLMKRTGFKYHEAPTNTYIYIYDTKKKAEAGQGLWLAMSQMGPLEKGIPRISIREESIGRVVSEPQVKFDLSQAQREDIFKQIVVAEDRAMQEAIRSYPSNISKQGTLEEKLKERYGNELAKRYDLTKEQLDAIAVEGLETQWVMPSSIYEVAFPPKRRWDPTRLVITFPMEVGGRQVPCAISMEALEDHYDAERSDPTTAFDTNRQTIESVTENLLRLERFESDGSILVRNSDIR